MIGLETIAAITTAKGIAAILSIELVGSQAAKIVEQIFEPAGTKQIDLSAGNVYTGSIVDEGNSIDHVVVGCLADDDFEINCHGNPLIAEKIIKLLASFGVGLVSAEQLVLNKLQSDKSKNAIQIESDIIKCKTVSVCGVKLIGFQSKHGLSGIVEDWLVNFDSMPLDQIKGASLQIIENSKSVNYWLTGVKAVIAGAPNSGKSTLLNALAGKTKAIVADIAGTTRDWLSTTIKTDRLVVEFFDTAGLDDTLVSNSNTDAASQATAMRLISQADLILYVVDPANPTTISQIDFAEGKKVIVVINKSDLGVSAEVDVNADATVLISAKNNTNIEKLINAIHEVAGVNDFDTEMTVCFTKRQETLLEQIADCGDKAAAKTLISQLLFGAVSV